MFMPFFLRCQIVTIIIFAIPWLPFSNVLLAHTNSWYELTANDISGSLLIEYSIADFKKIHRPWGSRREWELRSLLSNGQEG